jgi:hypothetical protein
MSILPQANPTIAEQPLYSATELVEKGAAFCDTPALFRPAQNVIIIGKSRGRSARCSGMRLGWLLTPSRTDRHANIFL